MNKRLQHETDYIKFLEKRLASDHYKKNVSAEEYEETKQKLKKARFILKTLQK